MMLPEEEKSIEDVAFMIGEIMGEELKLPSFKAPYPKFDPSKADGQFKKPGSAKVMRKYLPDFKFTSLEEGLRKTIRDFVKNYES